MKDGKVYLLHILESINLIETFTKGVLRKKFLKNIQKQDAVNINDINNKYF